MISFWLTQTSLVKTKFVRARFNQTDGRPGRSFFSQLFNKVGIGGEAASLLN